MKGYLRFAPLVLIAAVMAAVFAMGWHRQLSPELLYEHRLALKGFIAENFWAALALYMLAYVAVVALSLPGGLLMTVAGGFLLGWAIAAPAAVIAATIGAMLVFLAVRTAFGETLAARAGPWLERLKDGLKEDAFTYLLFLRLVPAFPFWLVNVAPALLGVPLATYVAATLIGVVPGTLAFAVVGAGLDSALVAKAPAYEACKAAAANAEAAAGCRLDLTLVTPELLIAFTLLGIVALIPVLLKRFRRAPAGS
jgi:uncharacterized membrane protein YdjX (TVP38/TMEM64 family)